LLAIGWSYNRSVCLLADVPDGKRRDGPPQRTIRHDGVKAAATGIRERPQFITRDETDWMGNTSKVALRHYFDDR